MIKFLDLHKINARFETQFKAEFQSFLDTGRYILGEYVTKFENNFANYCGSKYCVGTANGLDALTIILKSYIKLGKIDQGDEVLVPANTFIATFLSVLHAGLKPVFIEPYDSTFNINLEDIEKSITNSTKAIIAVHLYGQLADTNGIKKLAEANKLLVIEDAAQAHGAINHDGIKAGSLGDAAAFSFYPSKNLGALGDGGAITTHDEELFKMVRRLHNYGSSSKYMNDYRGVNSRLDDIQAMFLNIKLSTLDNDNEKRQAIARQYLKMIKNPKIKLPFYSGNKDHVFYAFVIQTDNRAQLKVHLDNNAIQYIIHYPIPPHKQRALHEYNSLSLTITEYIHESVISLPISPVMSDKEVSKVIEVLNQF